LPKKKKSNREFEGDNDGNVYVRERTAGKVKASGLLVAYRIGTRFSKSAKRHHAWGEDATEGAVNLLSSYILQEILGYSPPEELVDLFGEEFVKEWTFGESWSFEEQDILPWLEAQETESNPEEETEPIDTKEGA
jgi:hypothetical protein